MGLTTDRNDPGLQKEFALKTYVIYHGNCWDGFCAAWVFRKQVPDAEFIPAQYGQPEPTMECGSRVYLLDFSYKRQSMRNLMSQMHQVVVLDHHKTAEAALVGLTDEFMTRPDLINNPPGSELPIIHFDMNKSGGRLAWEFFANDGRSSLSNCPIPWLVEYTEDRDLWRWQLESSREINAWLRSHPLDFSMWDEFSMYGPGQKMWDSWIGQGSAILRREKQIIDEHVGHAREIVLAGHKILAVNATVLFSDIAGDLATGRPFGACYFDRQDGKRQWSLRSDENGIDVAEVAKSLGGGGHKQAAGFEEPIFFVREQT